MKKLVAKLFNWFKPVPIQEEHIDTLVELKRFRDVEDRTEQVCKLLKCNPDEMQARLNKILKHIEELEAEKAKLEEAQRPIDPSK
jgi:hypothetical protein